MRRGVYRLTVECLLVSIRAGIFHLPHLTAREGLGAGTAGGGVPASDM